MKISGVYKITNIITGEFYIGSSKNIKHRWANHKSPSAQKQQLNSKLYKAMAQYGRDNFIFEILEETDNLKEREQYWIKQLSPTYNDRHADGYNTERRKESTRRCKKEWYKSHRNERLAKSKAYYYTHREENKARMEKYNNAHRAEINNYYQRLCLYEGKTLTLNALKYKLSKLGFSHPVQEAKKYLL